MRAKREFRDRDEVEVAVLDALVERGQEGITVFELRSLADVDIDELEAALASLKADGLIEVDDGGDRTLIHPDERVVPDPEERGPDDTFLDRIRRRFPF